MTEKIPWSSVGFLVAKRTYARVKDESKGTTEEWHDIADRVIRAANEQLGAGFSVDEGERLRSHILQLRGTVAGRFL